MKYLIGFAIFFFLCCCLVIAEVLVAIAENIEKHVEATQELKEEVTKLTETIKEKQ